MKVKVLIGMDEWYPVYDFSTDIPDNPFHYSNIIEIEETTLERWKKVFEEFDKVQDELKEVF